MVGAANALARVTGLLREVAFAAAFGAGPAADAFNAAFRIGSLFRELFAEGSLSNAFVPLFAQIDEQEGAQSAWRLANAFLGVLLIAVGLASLGTALLAEPLVHIIAGGFAEDPAKFDLTARLTRVLAPFVATISVASLFGGMMNVRGRFFLPAITPMLFNVAVIGACVFGARLSAATGWEPIVFVAIAALIGGTAQAAVQLPSLLKLGFRLRPTLAGHPALKRLIRFLIPALIAISVVQLHLLIETQLASRQGDGAVSWLLYSFRIAHLPFSIVSGAVGVAALAGLSVRAAKQDWGGFRRDLAQGLNLNSYLILPAAVGLFLLADPIVALFFERGAFTPHDTAMTASLLRMYVVGLLGIGAQRILVPVFYTLDDPYTPMWAGVATLVIKLPLAIALMKPLGVAGLPLSHAILASCEVAVLLLILRKRVQGGLAGDLTRFHWRAAVAAGVMGALVWLGRDWAQGVVRLGALICASGLVYLVVGELVGLREGRALLLRMIGRGPRGLPPSIDPDSRQHLADLAHGPCSLPQISEGVAHITGPAGALVVTAHDGLLRVASGAGPDLPTGAHTVRAVVRVGGGPPQLAGIRIGDVHLRAEGDAVVDGPATGPVLDPLTGEEAP